MYAKRVFSSQNVFGFSSSFFSSGLLSAGFVSSGLAWPYAGALNAAPRSTAMNIPPSHRFIRTSSTLDCVVAALAGPDPHRFLERRDEHLPVADAPRPGGSDDERDDLVRQTVGDDDLHLHLRQEVYRVLAAAIHLRVTLLAAEAADLAHGHADDARARERFLDVVEL